MPSEADGIWQAYDRSANESSGPMRGVTIFQRDGQWSVDVYEAHGLQALEESTGNAANIVSSEQISLDGHDATVALMAGEASGETFHVVTVFIVGVQQDVGLYVSGTSERAERAVRRGEPLRELARIAVEESGLKAE